MNKAVTRTASASKPEAKSAKPTDKIAKSANKIGKQADKSAKSTEKAAKLTNKLSTEKSAIKTTTKSTAKSTVSVKSEDRSSNIEEIAAEQNPNCPCLGDCNCILLKTSETVSNEDDDDGGPGICVDFQPQHLVIDFTPTEELDSAANVEACLRLWEMLAKVPQWAKALGSEASASPTKDLSPRSQTEELPEPPEQERDHMAVSILNLMDKAGMTVPVFEVREQTPYCVDDQQDYFKIPSQVSCPHLPVRMSVKYNADGRPSVERKKPKPKKPVDVKTMNTRLNSWDDRHPKSMEPPGHPPETSSMVLARRKKNYGPCHREWKDCTRPKCDKDCGCHKIELKHA